jgi:hypothetical protein
MKTNRTSSVSALAFVWLLLALGFQSQVAANQDLQNTTAPASALQPIGGQWLSANPKGFIPNVGQIPNPAVKFTLRDGGVSAYFTEQGFVLWNGQTATVSQDGHEVKVPVATRWELVGAKPVTPIGGDTFPHTVSFFHGDEPANWHANVPAYCDLRYPEILKGIELRVEQRERGFEYSFLVQPHAKPDLRFRYDSITSLEKSLTGDLIVRTASGHFTESRPVSYQIIGGTRREVASSFELVSANEYRIVVRDYDEQHELVIDPVLDWSTFLGGSYVERLRHVGVDPSGNLVAAGDTYSTDFPATGAFPPGPGLKYDSNLGLWHEDAVVAKFTPDGTQLLWAVYLGGAGLTGDTTGPKGFAVNSVGDVYLAGFTDSPDFPVTGGPAHSGLSDGFVAKIKGDGSALLWSTLLGGTDEDWGAALALDSQENVFVAGLTRSANFPTLNAFDSTLGGAQDAFVARFNAAGNCLWSSFFGGNLGEDRVVALGVDANTNLFLFGDTESVDFPVSAGAYDTTLGGNDDAFVTKLAGDGTGILWSTFLGGSNKENDMVSGPNPPLNNLLRLKNPRGDIALDSAGTIVVAGQTYSDDFPTTVGAFDRTLNGGNDGFVTKLNSDGTQLLWSSYLGGSTSAPPDEREEIASGIAVNPWDEIFVIGWTYSSDFPVTPGGLKTSLQYNNRKDGYLTQFSADGSQLLYSTYIGGNENEDVALGVAYHSGNVFVTGWAQASTFPITAGTYQPGCVSCAQASMGYASDGYVMKFLDAFIAHDGFESGNYSGGEGWTGNWTASGDTSILSSSGPHSGSRHVRLRSSTGYLQRTINLPPGSTSVQLGFWAKVDSFESGDQAVVLAKSTGASFTTIASLNSAQSDNKYHYYELDLTSFLPATQIQIAFDAAMNANNDNWYLDDIRLTGTSAPVPPAANAGADQTVTDTDNTGAETVTLNGSASLDPDGGGIVAYEWKEGATVLGTAASLNTSLSVGVHTITLTVTDDEGATASDTVQVTVNPYVAPVQVFYDSFEVSEWNGLWTEDSQNDWFRSNQRATQGTWSAEVDGSASDASLTSINVPVPPGLNNATITFDWLIESGLDNGEYLEFRVSTNGGSTWTQKAILRGNVDPENSWRSVTVELTGITQLKLQFRGKMNQDDEDANVDNVRVVAH